MPTVAFCTLGCKVNQYDSQAMLELFEEAGYRSVPFSQPADVYVINTCTVTGTGDQKSLQMIRRAHRTAPGAALVVTGCMAQRQAEVLKLPGVRLVIGTQRRSQVVELLRVAMRGSEPLIAVGGLENAPFERLRISASEGHTRAALKIQEGCGNRCTYCIIPSVRGPARSRPLEDVEREAARLGAAGFREIVVTGIQLAAYGRDLEPQKGLLDALAAVARAEGVARIRLGSLEPGIMTEAFCEGLARIPAICPMFMLALQSGSETVLRRMGRRYGLRLYREAVERVRGVYGDPGLITDVMCGFPGETEEEFRETLAFVREIGFSRLHVFPYSEREGTPAARMPGAVPVPVREERAARLLALGRELEGEYVRRQVGNVREVLFEEHSQGGCEGYTGEYVRVRADGRPGELARVRITAAHGAKAEGTVLRDENGAGLR